MEAEGRVGKIHGKTGSRYPLRLDQCGGLVITPSHAQFHEAVNQNEVFFAANQSPVTTTVALAAAYTGLCVSNPAGSGKNLSIVKTNWIFTVAPAGICAINLGGGYAVDGVTVHTTPLTIYNAKLGSPASSVANADAAATLVGTPIYIQPLIGGFTAGVLYPHQTVIDMGGIVMVPPGAYVFISTLTVAVGLGAIFWEETYI